MVAIYSTLGLARTLTETLRERNLLRVSFALVVLLVVGAIAQAMGEEAPRLGRDRGGAWASRSPI